MRPSEEKALREALPTINRMLADYLDLEAIADNLSYMEVPNGIGGILWGKARVRKALALQSADYRNGLRITASK